MTGSEAVVPARGRFFRGDARSHRGPLGRHRAHRVRSLRGRVARAWPQLRAQRVRFVRPPVTM